MVVCERVCGGNGEFTREWDSLSSFLSLAALVKTGNSPLSTQLHNCTTAVLNSYIHIHTTVNCGCSSTIHHQNHVTEKDTKLGSMFSLSNNFSQGLWSQSLGKRGLYKHNMQQYKTKKNTPIILYSATSPIIQPF